VSVERFLKQRAVNIAVEGSYVLPNWYDCEGKVRTFACRTTRVSPFRMIVNVPVVGRIGDRLTSYFPDFGKFEGSISETMHGSFLLELEMTRERRERFSDKLTWLEKKLANPGIADARRELRFIPPNPHTTVTLADGSIYGGLVIDVSPSGVAVSSEVQPPLGTPLAIGGCVGRVIRNFSSGFAVRFIATHRLADVTRLISRENAPGRKLRQDAREKVPA
jgi:hypothetical protein